MASTDPTSGPINPTVEAALDAILATHWLQNPAKEMSQAEATTLEDSLINVQYHAWCRGWDDSYRDCAGSSSVTDRHTERWYEAGAEAAEDDIAWLEKRGLMQWSADLPR